MQFLMFGAFEAIVFAFLCLYEQNCGFSRPFGAFVWRFVTFKIKLCFLVRPEPNLWLSGSLGPTFFFASNESATLLRNRLFYILTALAHLGAYPPKI